MKQFDLSLWLKDKSHKVVTRDGRLVRIACTDSTILHHPIVGFVECDLFTWTDDGKVIYGGKCEDKNDLFFADEEELTEFEKCVQNILNEPHFQDVQAVKQFSKTLLDLARKEMMKDAVEGEIVYQIGSAEIAQTDIQYKVV